MKKIFIISDTHWTDRSNWIVEYIKKWNTLVGKDDTVFHLGDIAHNKNALPRLKQLNGHKILITGNHDAYSTSIYKEYFAEIHTHYLLRINGKCYRRGNVLLTHAPVCPEWKQCPWNGGPDNAELYTTYRNTIYANIHGHFHQYGISRFRHANTQYHESVPYTLFTVYDKLIELPHLIWDVDHQKAA